MPLHDPWEALIKMEQCGLIHSEEVPGPQDDEAAARRILTLAMPDRPQSVRGIRIGSLINVQMVQLRQALYMAALSASAGTLSPCRCQDAQSPSVRLV